MCRLFKALGYVFCKEQFLHKFKLFLFFDGVNISRFKEKQNDFPNVPERFSQDLPIALFKLCYQIYSPHMPMKIAKKSVATLSNKWEYCNRNTQGQDNSVTEQF